MSAFHKEHDGPITGTAFSIYFNRGSDARIMGLSMTACRHADARGLGFMAGWKQCDAEWGLDAKWPVKRLPEVK